jgi:serine/threonine protein kinase
LSSLDQTENRIVALKVIDVDSHDYKVNAREKDDSIEVTMHEIKVLKQLKDANTKNVNIIFDAFQIHSQLWIVNEYCPGGSVRTLVSLVWFVSFFPLLQYFFFISNFELVTPSCVWSVCSSNGNRSFLLETPQLRCRWMEEGHILRPA